MSIDGHSVAASVSSSSEEDEGLYINYRVFDGPNAPIPRGLPRPLPDSDDEGLDVATRSVMQRRVPEDIRERWRKRYLVYFIKEFRRSVPRGSRALLDRPLRSVDAAFGRFDLVAHETVKMWRGIYVLFGGYEPDQLYSVFCLQAKRYRKLIDSFWIENKLLLLKNAWEELCDTKERMNRWMLENRHLVP